MPAIAPMPRPAANRRLLMLIVVSCGFDDQGHSMESKAPTEK